MNSRLHRKCPFYMDHRIWAIEYGWTGLELIGLDMSNHPLDRSRICLHIRCSFHTLKYHLSFIDRIVSIDLHFVGRETSLDKKISHYLLWNNQCWSKDKHLQLHCMLVGSLQHHIFGSLGLRNCYKISFLLFFVFFLIFDENCRKKLDYKEDGHVRIDDFYDCRKVWLNHVKTLQVKIKLNMVKIL